MRLRVVVLYGLYSAIKVAILLTLACATAHAGIITWTDYPALAGQQSYTVDGVTVDAGPFGVLTWEEDGIGVRGLGGYEADEVEMPEVLTITFPTPRSAVWFVVADFFPDDHGWDYAEGAWLVVDGVVSAVAAIMASGDQIIPIGDVVSTVQLTGWGRFGCGLQDEYRPCVQDHDLSLRAVGWQTPTRDVNEPTTLALFGVVLIVLARRR